MRLHLPLCVCVCVRVCGRALAAWVCCSRRHASESGPVEGEERSWRYSLGKPQARRADWTALRHHVSHVLNSFHWKLANTEGDPLFCSLPLYFSLFLLSCAPCIPFRLMLLRREGCWNCKPAFEMENKFKKTSMDGFPQRSSHLHLLPSSIVCAGKGSVERFDPRERALMTIPNLYDWLSSVEHKWRYFEITLGCKTRLDPIDVHYMASL